MNFEKTTKVMKKLQEQGYVTENSTIKKDYMHIRPKCNENSVRSVIHTKIEDVMKNIEEEHVMCVDNGVLSCCNITKLKEVLELPTYKEMEMAFDNNEVDYVTISRIDTNLKCIIVSIVETTICKMVLNAIEKMDEVEVVKPYPGRNDLEISTNKAKEWERKKESCKEIKFIEDFNEILNEVEED